MPDGPDSCEETTLGYRIWAILSALALPTTPIALGSAYQDKIKFNGWFESLTYWWDDHLRLPLTTFFEMIGLTVDPYHIDYMLLGSLLALLAYSSGEVLGSTGEFFVREKRLGAILQDLCFGGMIAFYWPFVVAAILLFSIGQTYLKFKEGGLKIPLGWSPWRAVFILAPFMMFIGYALLSPGGPEAMGNMLIGVLAAFLLFVLMLALNAF